MESKYVAQRKFLLYTHDMLEKRKDLVYIREIDPIFGRPLNVVVHKDHELLVVVTLNNVPFAKAYFSANLAFLFGSSLSSFAAVAASFYLFFYLLDLYIFWFSFVVSFCLFTQIFLRISKSGDCCGAFEVYLFHVWPNKQGN